MVLIQRRLERSPLPTDSASSGGLSDVPFGNNSPNMSASGVVNHGFSFSANQKHARSTRSSNLPWITKAVCLSILLSWTKAYFTTNNARQALEELKMARQSFERIYDEAHKFSKEATVARRDAQKANLALNRENKVLKHEIRVVTEIENTRSNETRQVAQRKKRDEKAAMNQHDLVVQKLENRQESLKDTVTSLQKRVQENSRREVLEKYGPGPHRVQFTVELVKDRPKNFVVELASLDYVPHSVHTFLEQVSNRLWDNTVFMHRPAASHVLLAEPFDTKSETCRRNHFRSLGLAEVAFPEYSPNVPHKTFTLGFSGRGPNFFINAKDNLESHGPHGAQHYHDMPDDANPCFGRVVQGQNIVELINRVNTNKQKARDNLDGNDVTYILKVQVLNAK